MGCNGVIIFLMASGFARGLFLLMYALASLLCSNNWAHVAIVTNPRFQPFPGPSFPTLSLDSVLARGQNPFLCDSKDGIAL